MPLSEPKTEVLQGRLYRSGEALAVSLAVASRISLYVSFEKDDPPADRTSFERLVIQLGERELEFSASRLHVEYTRKGFSGRLVFLEDIYDCRALFVEGQFVNLRGFFHNLPQVMGKRQHIRPEFRDYTAAALFDLSVYKKFFNEQDRILANEPPEVAEVAQEALLRTEGQRFLRFFDAQLAGLQEVVRDFRKEDHERHGFYFRRCAWEFILGSEFLKRTNLKPRGYAGDAEMMQMCYENRYLGSYVFNQLMHKHPVETPAAQAVRNRRRMLPGAMRAAFARFPTRPDAGFRLLSVASGPAWELQDLFRDPSDFEHFRVTLLDQDPQALSCARAVVAQIEASRNAQLKVDYLNESVRTMLRSRDLHQRLGRFHFIYSMGLFDYLTPPVAKAVLAKIYDLLEPGGTMVVGNYHLGNSSRYYMEYWMDWVLYYRAEDEFLALAETLPGATPTIFFEETKSQMFLSVEKQH